MLICYERRITNMDITDYSAWSHDGQDWTEAFQRAIGAMKNQGGGELTVSPGVYPTGPIRPFFSSQRLERAVPKCFRVRVNG